LKGNIEERACQLALYIIENRATVRGAARKFGISKSTVHIEDTKWNGPTGKDAAPICTVKYGLGQRLCFIRGYFRLFSDGLVRLEVESAGGWAGVV